MGAQLYEHICSETVSPLYGPKASSDILQTAYMMTLNYFDCEVVRRAT